MSFLKKLKSDINEEEENEESTEEPKEEKTEEKEEKKEEKTKTKKQKTKEDKNWMQSEGQLAVDVYQTDSSFYIQAPIAGVDIDDLDVEMENEMLSIKGERKEPEVSDEKSYFYQECYWGPFSRQIILPEDADTEKIKANFEKGILTVEIPKTKTNKKKKISIESN